MKKILIINPFGIGDVLFTTPVIEAVKKKFPNSFIGYLCNEKSAPILENNPHVDKMFFYTRGDLKRIRQKSQLKYLKAFFNACRQITREKFDLAIDLSMVNQYSLLLWLMGVKQRWGFDYKGRGLFLTDKIKFDGFINKHVVDYYEDLLLHFKIDAFEKKLKFYTSLNDEKFVEKLLKQNKITSDDILIGIAPFGGASWGPDAANKQWPAENFLALIDELLKNFKVKVILFGRSEDRTNLADFERVISKERVVDAVGKTTLGQLAVLIAKCKVFISNDSGPLHIACAQEVPTISIFGPVDETVYGPVGGKNENLIIVSEVKCRPCYKDFKKPVCQRMDCLKTINVDMVVKNIEKLIIKVKSKEINRK